MFNLISSHLFSSLSVSYIDIHAFLFFYLLFFFFHFWIVGHVMDEHGSVSCLSSSFCFSSDSTSFESHLNLEFSLFFLLKREKQNI